MYIFDCILLQYTEYSRIYCFARIERDSERRIMFFVDKRKIYEVYDTVASENVCTASN